MERITQEALASEVAISSKQNQYDIVLDLGPYTIDFSASGQHIAVAGRKGHLAIIDAKNMELIKEMKVRETVRDMVFLHNDLSFAVAQKKYPYIYSKEGVELHCLKEHGSVLRLQFLRNHFLLASINKSGQLHYQDITTGQMIGNLPTGLGRADVMQMNPCNAVVAVGHSGGTVSMWKPTSAAPLVKMLCHFGPITAMAFHPNGHLMATSGKEKKIKILDLRKYEVLQTIPANAKTLDFSQKGLLAAGTGSFVSILGDPSQSGSYNRYMGHSMVKGYQVGKALFRPYEDVLCIGHSMGWSSILVPGSGRKQGREKEVHALLDKLPPETIMLDPPKIGTVSTVQRKEKPSKQEIEAEDADIKKKKKEIQEDMDAAVEEVRDTDIKKKRKRSKKKKEAVDRAKKSGSMEGIIPRQ